MYYVYVIMSDSGEKYYGYSQDIENRLKAHNKGLTRTTRGKKWELVYYEAYKSAEDARRREKQIKNSGQARRWLKERIAGSIERSSRNS